MVERRDDLRRRTRSKAGKLLLVTVAVMASLLLVTWMNCGCGEEGKVKENAPEQVEERKEDNEAEDAGASSAAGKTPSQALMEEAIRQGKPVFLNFHSNQCIPCIEMEKAIHEVEPEYEGRVAFVVVDVYDPAEMPLCEYFQVRVIPTSFFIRADGSVVDAYEGLLRAPELRVMLDRLLGGQS
jgi:thioredoxin 1